MSTSDRLKSNGTRLGRLIIDQGTTTLRKFFDSIHPPATLTATLYLHYDKLSKIKGIKREMKKFFPPSGALPSMPSTSKDYDITSLFILIRNICGLTPPVSTGSWDEKPPSADHSREADLVRIKCYRNEIYAHIQETAVSDADFDIYWSEISDALQNLSLGLGVDISDDIAYLKTCHLDDGRWIYQLNEWYRNDKRSEVLMREINKNTRYLECLMAIVILAIFSGFIFFLPSYFQTEQEYFYRQNFSNPSFVGRGWVFRRLENILNASDVRGILLVVDPGWGKSAIMKRLIHSPSSSAVIHENIIGYHFCKFNEDSTRDGEQFVKNLVNLIAKKISEFREIVNKVHSNCKENPIECFKKAIVEPLQKLSNTGRNNSFILIDALDECLEKEEGHLSIIVNILSSSDNVPELPNWVKLIVTSRNQAQTCGKISKITGFSTLNINVADPCNLQDLRNYAKQTLQMFYSEVPSMEEKMPLNRSIDLAVEFSQGNFLFLDTIIKLWRKYPDKMNAEYIPEDLGDIYTFSFAARFKEAAFADFQPLLEILLAAKSPPTLLELDKILNYHYKNYNTRGIVLKLSEYFKSDIDQGPLEFHHQFLAEWLVNQTDGSNGIVIQKSRGHQYIVDYLFHFYSERQTKLSFKELLELCTHILHGGKATVSNMKKLSSLKSEVRRSLKSKVFWANYTILHYLASRRDATELIAVFIKQFNSVDILDLLSKSPAMVAVEAGIYENVKLFIDNGANVNHMVKAHIRAKSPCFLLDFLVPENGHRHFSTMSSVAISLGDTKIAKLLLESGANIEKADECGWKPLYWVALMGNFEMAQLYINKGARPDLISLHHAAARNNTEVVQFLLNIGVRDKCLACDREVGQCDWLVCLMPKTVSQHHHCFCETALHAAVSRDNLEIAKLILQYGDASVNCKHGSGRTPLMEAFSRKNTEMVELLISAGADINADCYDLISNSFHDNCNLFIRHFKMFERWPATFIYSCNNPCDGNRLSLEHGFWEMMILLISQGKLNALSDSVQRSMTTVAVILDQDIQVDFINAMYGNRIYSIPSIETILRYVAVCHSVETLKHFLNSDDLSKFTVVYEDGKTLLHFATLGLSKRKTEVFVTQSCVCPEIRRANVVGEKRLETVKLLMKALISDINKQDKYGRTTIHYATVQVLPEVVKYFVNAGADWSIKDQRGDNALEFALREISSKGSYSDRSCPWRSDNLITGCYISTFDEIASYLLQNATIKECDMRVQILLRSLFFHKLPLSLYTLFKSGLDVNCAQEHYKRILSGLAMYTWKSSYDEILEIFNLFQINMDVVCGVPLKQSELHIMAYIRKRSDRAGNFFQPSVNGTPFPLQRFIASHPKGVEILNECYDKEGYLAIHRAVQGANSHAVSWFIEIGADIFKKTKSNLTTLTLAITQLEGPYIYHRDILQKLLEKYQEKCHAIIHCNAELVDLSPLHVAGSRGMAMMEMIHRELPALPLNCTNSHGIQPIYLAYLYHGIVPYFSWNDVKAFDYLGLSLHKGPLKYPEREAEYHLIYNQFYRTPQEDLRNVLNHEGLFQCPGINELLPNETEIKDYKRLKACATRCWPSALEASREFSSNFRYLKIPNNFSNPFTDKFTDISHHMAELRFHLVKMFHFSSLRFISISTLEKELWRKVTKAHSCARSCSCFEIMQLLQETFTSKPVRYNTFFHIFIAERMGWTNRSSYKGDVKYRWPFSFLLKKALRTDKAYKYLEILSPHFKLDSI